LPDDYILATIIGKWCLLNLVSKFPEKLSNSVFKLFPIHLQVEFRPAQPLLSQADKLGTMKFIGAISNLFFSLLFCLIRLRFQIPLQFVHSTGRASAVLAAFHVMNTRLLQRF